jgi:hypothetical protein
MAAAQERAVEGPLPEFVTIGAQRSGTSFFHRLLVGHPLVRPAVVKELHFFDLHFAKGPGWYRRCFPPPDRKDGRKALRGEATPSYLFDPRVPERMAETIPDAKLIALLRNPVDRAYAQYQMEKERGTERRAFAKATHDEMAGEEGFAYLARGLYAEQLTRFAAFARRGRLLVLCSEDFFARPREVFHRALDFLDLPPSEPKHERPANKKAAARYGPMDPGTRRLLEEFFEPQNRRLYELLGSDFGW